MRRLFSTAAGLWAAFALAQPLPPSLSLTYEAPTNCPAAADVFAEVKHLRGDLVADETKPDVRARVRVRPRGSGWSAEVETFSNSGAGRRTLEADTCLQATEALAVVLALALSNPLVPLPSPPTVTAPEPQRPESVRIRPYLGLTGAGRFGVLPSVMAVGQLVGGFEWKRLRLEGRVGLAAPSIVQGESASAEVESWFQAAIAGCAAVIEGTGRLEFCAALDAVLLAARGRGVSAPGQGSMLWLAAMGGAAVRTPLWRQLGLVLDGALGIALARPRFFIQVGETTATVHESPLLTGRLGLSLQWGW